MQCTVKFKCVLRNIIVLVKFRVLITIVFLNLNELRQSVSSNEMS